MKFRYWFLVSSIFTLSLSGCNGGEKSSAGVAKPLDSADIAALSQPSIVLITYEERAGNGTGFFVPGEKNVCTVLTARHVIGASSRVQLQTHDLQLWKTSKIQLFPNQDLAVLTFDSGSQDCPYKALELGNSDSLKIGHNVYLSGFPGEDGSGKINRQFVSSNVSAKEDVTDGYAISYTAITADGMSGGPVFDKIGKVVAVHGRAGRAVAKLVELKAGKLSQQPQSGAATNFDGVGVEIDNFKWAIPINTYLANINKISAGDVASERRAEDWFNIANDLYVSQRYEEAVTSFDKAIQFNPDYALAWNNRGGALGALKRHDDALASVDKAIQINPDDAGAWNNRGAALGELKRHNDALASFDKAIQIKPDDAGAWRNRGIVLRELKRYDNALVSYNKAIQIKPDLAEAWFGRGIVLSELKRYDDALASYNKAIQIKPDDAEAWYNRGTLLSKLERYNDAVASYNKAIQIKPDYAEAWNNRGFVLSELKRYDDALASIDKAIEIKPNLAKAWYNRGTVIGELKRYDDALASYNKAIQIKPDLAEAWYNRGTALGELNRYSEAVASFDKAIQINPDLAEAWFGRGFALHLQERNKEALESVDKALQMNPNVEQAQELRKMILQELGR